MAAGITVQREKLGELRAFFEERAGDMVAKLRRQETLLIDGALSADGATQQLFDQIEKAGPFGSGHASPVFAFPRHRIANAQIVGTGHVRTELRSLTGRAINAVTFRAAETPLGHYLLHNVGRSVHAAGSLSANYWNGQRSIQLRLTDAAVAD